MSSPNGPGSAQDAAAIDLPPEPTTMPPPSGGVTGADYDINTSEAAAARGAVPADDGRRSAGRWTAGTLTYTTGGLVALFLFLLGGDFALSMRDRGVAPVLQLIVKRLHANDRVMSLLIITLPAATSLLVVPVISYKSDRTRTRWGRRIPWLMATTPIAAACMVAIAYADRMGGGVAALVGLGHRAAEVCGLALIGLFWTAFECTATNPSPLVGGLINDVVPRPVLGRFYGLFRAVSLIAGVVFNHWIIGTADVHFRSILVGIGVLFFVGFAFMCLTVREGHYPPPPPADPNALSSSRRWAGIKAYLHDSFQHGYYVWIFAGLTLAALAFVPFNGFSLPFSLQVNLSMQAYGDRISLGYACSLFLAWPVGWLVDRTSALIVAAGCMVLYGAVMLVAAVGVHSAPSFGLALLLHTVLSGCYFTSSASLGQALFPRDKYGQFFSAAGAVQALVTVAFGPVLGSVLDWSGHNYRITLYAGCLMALAATACLLVVHFSRPPAEDAADIQGFAMILRPPAAAAAAH